MPKDTKCSTKQPCNPQSDDSEVCDRVVSEKDCCIEKCSTYTPEEIVCQFKDAVVEIHSEFILLGGTTGAPIISATGGTPIAPGVRSDVILEGNGFFIKGHYIIAPAHLVLLPPSLSSVVNRWPLFDSNNLSLGNIRNQLVRASRILVSVFNVNGEGHSFVYEADLIGVDGAGDIAVLKINYKRQWNFCNPYVEKRHPFFKFGSSRASKDGEKVYLIGDYLTNQHNPNLFNAVGAITEGLLSDHRYLEYSGWLLSEAVVVSAPVYAYNSGLPIINGQGQVIGMQTTSVAGTNSVSPDENLGIINPLFGSGLVAGPSEFFMRRIIKTIIKGSSCRRYNCQLETVCDPAGAFYKYRKAYTGIAYDVFNGVDYDTTTNFTSGDFNSGLPRIRLTSTGDFLNSPSCKELIGIRVLGLAGLNVNDLSGVTNGQYFVPGGTGTIAPFAGLNLPVSPFLGKLLPGDVITHVNDVALGDLNRQIAPSLVTWRLGAGDQITLTYRRGGNEFNSTDNGLTENYDNLFSYTGCLSDFPPVLDYPWYAVNIFPLLNDFFPLGVNQLAYPLYPARFTPLGGTGIFHPSF